MALGVVHYVIRSGKGGSGEGRIGEGRVGELVICQRIVLSRNFECKSKIQLKERLCSSEET
jgi:hypothetical protein